MITVSSGLVKEKDAFRSLSAICPTDFEIMAIALGLGRLDCGVLAFGAGTGWIESSLM